MKCKFFISVAAMSILFCLCSIKVYAEYQINYYVNIDTEDKYVNVTLVYSSDKQNEEILFKMPVWAPGYYIVVDFPKYLTDFTAEDETGKTLLWNKVGKNGWKVKTNSYNTIIKYRIYANQRSVAECRVEDKIAFIAPNGVFMYVDGDITHEAAIHFNLPHGWNKVSTGLMNLKGKDFSFFSPDFDRLYDSPFMLGNHFVDTFDIDGHIFEFALEQNEGYNDSPFKEDFIKMVKTTTSIMKDLPYDNYCLIHLANGQGGLEHLNSQACYTDGTFKFSSREQYLAYLSFTTHEYFHLYNVKAIRPIELGPFDYDSECFTNMLWFSEGITVYYETRIMNLAGICDADYLLNDLSGFIATIESKEGHKHMSLKQSSYDIWLNFFNRAENGDDVRISYYNKGPIIGLLMDIDIRRKTDGKKSLDDLMRRLYDKYFKQLKRGFTEMEFWQEAADIAGKPLDDIRRYVETTDEINYDEILEDAGLGLNSTNFQLYRLDNPKPKALAIRKEMGL